MGGHHRQPPSRWKTTLQRTRFLPSRWSHRTVREAAQSYPARQYHSAPLAFRGVGLFACLRQLTRVRRSCFGCEPLLKRPGQPAGWKQPRHVVMPVTGEVPAKPQERSCQSSDRRSRWLIGRSRALWCRRKRPEARRYSRSNEIHAWA